MEALAASILCSVTSRVTNMQGCLGLRPKTQEQEGHKFKVLLSYRGNLRTA